MKTKPSTSLVIPASLVPPPRKEDIITAMTERALVKHQEEQERLEKLRNEAEEALNAAVLQDLKQNPKNFKLRVSAGYNNPEVEYSMLVVPPHITKLKAALRACPCLRSFDFAATKKRIREGMNTSGDRVKALLNNEQMVKTLDAALDKLV